MLHAMLRAAVRDFYAQEVLADSPVAYWRLGEASGTTAFDEVGGYDGTYTGSPTLGATGLIAGDSDTAMSLASATDDGVTIPNHADLMPTTAISVEAWFTVDAANSGNSRIVAADQASTTQTYHLLLNSSRNFSWRVKSGGTWYGGDFDGDSPTADGSTIYHMVGTYDGSYVRLYINGVAQTTTYAATGPLNVATADLELGFKSTQPDSDFAGTLDEVAIYDAALSAARIEAHYNAGTT